jgi:hypothetical protein
MEDGATAKKKHRNGLKKNAGYFQERVGFVMNATPIL